MSNDIIKLIKLSIEKIKDEMLQFSIIAVLIIVSFPDLKEIVFTVYVVAVLVYAILTGIKLSKRQSSNQFLKNFEKFLEDKDGWERRTINHSVVYFYTEDNNYQITQGDELEREWEPGIEEWMTHFPDQLASEWKVYLKYGGNIISQYSFMSCDGARYLIPLPKKRCAESGENLECDRFEYVWHRGAIEYKIGTVIGEFYRYDNLEEVARFCNIVIE